ncbi:peptidyl-prolyl cis-trans isomerase [Candidatus Woesearchaeota archaeon]|nr:peptidyl-prolyl cis-trans isomerase [Candidatus Woesearchaeota archaeon]
MDENTTGNVVNEATADTNTATRDAVNTIVVIETSKGNIEVQLDADKAPISVENFLKYVDVGFYDGTVFHRVISNFMIQGGGFTADGKQKSTNSPIKLESQNGLKNLRGTIAMARTSVPDSATSQFFINVVDNDFLNYRPGNDGYAVFGKVVSGMDIVDSIKQVETGSSPMADWPKEAVTINKVYRK